MTAVRSAAGKVLAKFRAVKVMTITELTLLLNCSVRTVRRRLKSWRAISSYNGNGRFYALPQVVRFDENGLWCWRGARFSRHGTLTETVTALVNASDAGLTAAELSDILGLNAHSFISAFAAHQQLTRERIAGRYVYFASDSGLRQTQRRARLGLDPGTGAELPSDGDAVLIFAEMIRCPELEPEQISRRLAADGVRVDAQQIRRLLRRHALPKKRAPDSASSVP